MDLLPPPLPGTALRVLSTSDLGATTLPLRASHGESGTCAGLVALLERERERVPAIWLDLGDFVVGHPSFPVREERPWEEVADLPIAAATVGNHEFDDGVEAMRAAVARLRFPVLCANVDVGLDPSALVPTEGGPVGVIGLTHPRVDVFTQAPPAVSDVSERVTVLAKTLRRDGARWVVVLLHDGVEWWPQGAGIDTRADRLDGVAAPWARHVDLILCGHNFGDWTGALAGTPAAEPHLFASSVAVCDLMPDRAIVRGIYRVPAVRPTTPSAARHVVESAAARVVAELPTQWVTRSGAPHYLPDLLAGALRRATGAEAGLIVPNYHGIQAPFDGVLAALGPGPVTELDLLRLFGSPGMDPVVVELGPGELKAAAAAQWLLADPANTAADALPENWCRMPLGLIAGTRGSGTVAMIPAVVPRVSEWLGRELNPEPAGVEVRSAVASVLAGR
ncbi:MAG TPA: metallophosphoesterase [Solirubrobacteraceae bacterium]|nr:metallophosphoesterase [Solirubrobacteraceae bacterium]